MKHISWIITILIFGSLLTSSISIIDQGKGKETISRSQSITLIVDQHGGGDHDRIQDAVDNASHGDTIKINKGLYKEYITMKEGIKLLGDPQNYPILDATDLPPGAEGRMFIKPAANTWIEGIHFRNSDRVMLNQGLENITFCRNFMENIEWGGIHNWDGGKTIIYNNIFRNISYAVYSVAGRDIPHVAPSNDTIVNNIFDSCQDAIYGPSGIQRISNNIFINCDTALSHCKSEETSISNNIYWNNKNHHYSTPLGSNELFVDPEFIDEKYHIDSGSPAIDTGDPRYNTGYDFENFIRPFDGDLDGEAIVDIGIYEKHIDLYVDDDNDGGPWDGTIEYPFQRIDQAIENSTEGDILYISNGEYTENIEINTKLKILGQSMENTITKGDGSNDSIVINASGVQLSEISINNEGSRSDVSGVYLTSNSSKVLISRIKIEDHNNSILVDGSNDNKIENCTFYNNLIGMNIRNGSERNVVWRSIFERNELGLLINGSVQSTVLENRFIRNRQYGVWIGDGNQQTGNNRIFQNQFENNSNGNCQANDSGTGENYWFNFDREGNYWSDFQMRYPNSTYTGYIWNTPYELEGSSNNNDPYPLVMIGHFDPLVTRARVDGPIFDNMEIQFNGETTSGGVGQLTFTWSFIDHGVPVVLSGAVVAYVFQEVGTYNITLNVTDELNNWDITIFTITVMDGTIPFAFAGPDIIADQFQTVYFNGSLSSDNIVISEYTWTFEYDHRTITLDGSIVSYTFDIPGNYDVTLRVMDPSGNIAIDTINVSILELIGPIADAGPDIEILLNETAILDGTGSSDDIGISNWTWTFSYNGSVWKLYGNTTNFKFDIPGKYLVKLTVRDTSGLENEDAMIVNVKKVIEEDPILKEDDLQFLSILVIVLIFLIVLVAIAAVVTYILDKKNKTQPDHEISKSDNEDVRSGSLVDVSLIKSNEE